MNALIASPAYMISMYVIGELLYHKLGGQREKFRSNFDMGDLFVILISYVVGVLYFVMYQNLNYETPFF